MSEAATITRSSEAPPDIQQVEWMPMNEEYMARRGIELFREWVAAGMPRKDE